MSRTAEEWGRIAVSLPGWRWMRGMVIMWSLDEDPVMPLRLIEDAGAGHPGVPNPVWSGVRYDREHNDHEIDPKWCWPDPDDPATAGCLVEMLDGPVSVPFTVEQHRGPLTVMGTWVAIGQRHDGQWEVRLWGMGPDGWTKHGTVIGADAWLGRACIAAAQHLGRWPGGEG